MKNTSKHFYLIQYFFTLNDFTKILVPLSFPIISRPRHATPAPFSLSPNTDPECMQDVVNTESPGHVLGAGLGDPIVTHIQLLQTLIGLESIAELTSTRIPQTIHGQVQGLETIVILWIQNYVHMYLHARTHKHKHHYSAMN